MYNYIYRKSMLYTLIHILNIYVTHSSKFHHQHERARLPCRHVFYQFIKISFYLLANSSSTNVDDFVMWNRPGRMTDSSPLSSSLRRERKKGGKIVLGCRAVREEWQPCILVTSIHKLFCLLLHGEFFDELQLLAVKSPTSWHAKFVLCLGHIQCVGAIL